MKYGSARRGLLSIALAATLSACAGPRIELAARAGIPSAQTTCRSDRSRDVLLLSSGGADGAFGAGVLAGWTASGTRPRFDVVTGVSTGALQATSAFLGSEQDAVLRHVYTTIHTNDVLKSNGLLAAIFAPGLYRLTPLRKRLGALIDEPLLDRVAAEHNAGRRLYVGTTDLTHGHTVIWDMGAIAASQTADRQARYIAVLLASSAVPGFIEPVVVHGEDGRVALHGDGATKAPLLFEASMLEGNCPKATTVWAVANGHVSARGALTVQPKRTLSVARRGVSQMMRRFLYATTVVTAHKVQESGANFRLLALPNAISEASSPFEFHPAEMAGLYQAGLRLGRDPASWCPAPDVPQRPLATASFQPPQCNLRK